jgi:hypothetical protein
MIAMAYAVFAVLRAPLLFKRRRFRAHRCDGASGIDTALMPTAPRFESFPKLGSMPCVLRQAQHEGSLSAMTAGASHKSPHPEPVEGHTDSHAAGIFN